MTKKHFIALADAITDYNKHAFAAGTNTVSPLKFEHMQLLCLADFCASQNPQFNRERWLGYIAGTNGANGGTVKPPRQPRVMKPERKLARRLEGRCAHGKLRHCEVE